RAWECNAHTWYNAQQARRRWCLLKPQPLERETELKQIAAKTKRHPSIHFSQGVMVCETMGLASEKSVGQEIWSAAASRRTPMSRQSSAFAFFLKLLLFENWRGSSLPPHI